MVRTDGALGVRRSNVAGIALRGEVRGMYVISMTPTLGQIGRVLGNVAETVRTESFAIFNNFAGATDERPMNRDRRGASRGACEWAPCCQI